MAPLNSNIHYVKFMRGSPSAWETLLATPEKISDDTLYFIYETNNQRKGKLYLGQKLIGGDNIGGNIDISDIGDVYIDGEHLSDKQILVYNDTTQQWENKSLSTIIKTAVDVMQGATSAAAGTSGLVPVPVAGDQVKFLRGDGTWVPIDVPVFDSTVFELNLEHEITLKDIVQAPVGTIPVKNSEGGISWANVGAGTIQRAVITMAELEEAIANGTTTENTIYMVPNSDPEDQHNLYSEYMVISGNLELLGTTVNDINLSNYVTTSTFNTAVGDINNILNDTTDNGVTTPGLVSRVTFLETNIGDLTQLMLSSGNSTLVEEVNTINEELDDLDERLKWHELNNQD